MAQKSAERDGVPTEHTLLRTAFATRRTRTDLRVADVPDRQLRVGRLLCVRNNANALFAGAILARAHRNVPQTNHPGNQQRLRTLGSTW